jgi:hypothetical protein
MIVEQIKRMIPPGTTIPKPNTRADCIVKGWGRRRGENALIYLIPNHKNSKKPYEKGITESEWKRAYQQIINKGDFSRKWFNRHMKRCSEEGGCNFTTIGGIFQLLGIAVYEKKGAYYLQADFH